MRSYTLTSLVASLYGWFWAVIIYSIAYLTFGIPNPVAGISLVAAGTIFISVLANFLLFQLPQYLVKKAFFRVSKWSFAMTYSILAILILGLLFRFHFDNNPVEKLMYLNAATNGFVFGFVFHSTWKPSVE